MMGGDIWVESKVGIGSKFAFTVNFEVLDYDGLPEQEYDINWSNLSILVVDDMIEVIDYFREISEGLGINCTGAQNGDEALELINRNGPYDIYFVDYHMPGLAGVDLCRIIKERHGNDKSFIIMISSTEWSFIEDEARAAGVDRFLSKPLFPSNIVDLINACIGIRGSSGIMEVEVEMTDFTGRTLLLAEDVEINCEIVTSFLEPTNINIEWAENGEIALNMFADNPDKYDLILMDVQMPVMSGYEATRRIRALNTPRAKTVPIIAMTANVFREDIERSIESGMNDHIGKPISLDDVMDKLQKYLSVK
jgi:CheY-like chemotaxis protein